MTRRNRTADQQSQQEDQTALMYIRKSDDYRGTRLKTEGMEDPVDFTETKTVEVPKKVGEHLIEIGAAERASRDDYESDAEAAEAAADADEQPANQTDDDAAPAAEAEPTVDTPVEETDDDPAAAQIEADESVDEQTDTGGDR